ncbi:hypothetical protein [Rossellomorea aquimaris]|uniref:Glycoamylase-like domain-containing protein n=1 Tax=Rossellomorea aquimaris TaxID=189382 RepID=A0A5D4TJ06_9BACI|nr:hypothetical protein [Rossellomorea aquimaris]TYS75810.1 hypothetical protein FZC80_16540 [Rossellomorea aquimaris]
MKVRVRRKLLFLLLMSSLILSAYPAKAESNEVKPIEWNSFSSVNPIDEDSVRIQKILLNSTQYGLTTWWKEEMDFESQKGSYLELGGTGENAIRRPAAMSLGIAASLAFNVYDSSETGVSEFGAELKAQKLISSLAYRHKSNSPDGWGDEWQSAHWTYFAGFAGWLLWEDLSSQDQEYIKEMVEYEADRFLDYEVPYWKDESGTIIFEGDTKAEENAWNAQLLQLATAMMPNHENYLEWMNKNIELMISSAAVPSDLESNEVLHGRQVKDWVMGSNINEDGTAVNHGFLHPDYMEFIAFNNTSGLHYSLAGLPVPKAAFHHSDLVYSSLSQMNFESPPYESPGGTIYREGSSDIYYPEGNDWGTSRRMQFAVLDIFADVFQYDGMARNSGEYWESFHAEMVLAMQERHVDGRTYDERWEDTYSGREEWIAHHAAWAWIAKWIDANGALCVSNTSYSIMNREMEDKQCNKISEVSFTEAFPSHPPQTLPPLFDKTHPWNGRSPLPPQH